MKINAKDRYSTMFEAYLNGERVEKCMEADEGDGEHGYVLVHKKDENGRWIREENSVLPWDDLKLFREEGQVEIRLCVPRLQTVLEREQAKEQGSERQAGQ